MIRFLLKGLLRDKHRSLLPLIVVTIGSMLTVFFQSFISGVIGDGIEFNARFTTGHVKVTTAAYGENIDQMPNDLALLGADSLVRNLNSEFPDIDWAERIHFGGLIDVPDSNGETRQQGTVVGFGIDLLSGDTRETDRMNLHHSIKKGRLPTAAGEILLSNSLAEKLGLNPGDTVSFIGSTMYGEMAIYDFVLAGMVEFGVTAIDRGAMIADISDVRKALNMEDATGEILGFFKGGYYDDKLAVQAASLFNRHYDHKKDIFSPLMKSLKSQNSMGFLVDYSNKMLGILILVFLIAMSIVLWNAGLLGGIRRYGEFGMRLAVGESKGHVYKTLIYESLLIGIVGSVAGIAIGLAISWYFQEYGLYLGNIMKDATIMMPSTYRARISTETWFIGFIPGVFSKVIGTMLSGIGIYKRQTAQLFKELEA
jgi:putative ABC transport system permease protein